MATVSQVSNYNKTNVDWSRFFSAVETIGSTMNGQKDRFDKSDLIEKALSHFSNGAIQYANYDGIDHLLTNLLQVNGDPTTQEMKFQGGSFYNHRVVQRASKKRLINSVTAITKLNKPVTVKLTNSNGENKRKSLPSTYAEFLLVVDNYSAFVVKVSDLTPYLKFNGDGIEAKKVPVELFEEIIGPTAISAVVLDSDYKERKNKMQEDFLNQF